MKIVSIIGLGLMGGSLGMAIKKRELAEKVIGVARREETLHEAKEREAIDEGTLDIARGVAEADMVILATSVWTIMEMLKTLPRHLPTECLVTDVGSTKVSIVQAAERYLPETSQFIGGHPMAGSDKSGIEWAKADLFEGATYVLTPTKRTDERNLSALKGFVFGLGAKPLIISPEEHDRLVAATSHLPHFLAVALVSAIAELRDKEPRISDLLAGGFDDMTRIAQSKPELWRDIFFTNKENVKEAVKEFKENLEKLEKFIIAGDEEGLLKELTKAKEIREEIGRRKCN